jgi:hypothetical protein
VTEACCCCWLRAKGAYGRGVDVVAWTTGESPQDAYWCLRTQEPFGPDDQLVHAARCRTGRRCFEAAPPPITQA